MHKKRSLALIILAVYVALIINVLVFKNLPVIRIGSMMFAFGGTHNGPPNFIPFKTVLRYMNGEKGLLIPTMNILGNIVLLVPVGWLLPIVGKRITWKKSIAVAIATGLGIEGMQALLHVGIFDVDDVLLNATGVVLGYITYHWLSSLPPKQRFIFFAVVFVVALTSAALVYQFLLSQAPRHTPIIEGMTPAGDSIVEAGITVTPDKAAGRRDPCAGTGGTGQIIRIDSTSIILQGHNGHPQTIGLTAQTVFKSRAGIVSKKELKTGDHITVVLMTKHIASVVFVCDL